MSHYLGGALVMRGCLMKQLVQFLCVVMFYIGILMVLITICLGILSYKLDANLVRLNKTQELLIRSILADQYITEMDIEQSERQHKDIGEILEERRKDVEERKIAQEGNKN
jgi:hypothetical protein